MSRTFAQRIEKPLHTAGHHRHAQRQGLPRPQPRTRITAPMARYIGTAAILLGAAELLPLAVLLFYPQEQAYAPCFVFPALITMAAGYLLRITRGQGSGFAQLESGEAAACTLLVWVGAIAAYAAPLALCGALSPVQAAFEATSGLTTTGLSIVNPDVQPHIILMHRSLMHYLGGVGLVLVLTCLVSRSGGLKAYSLEGHTYKVVPGSSARTARAILLAYTGIILLGALALWLAGTGPFDALNIAISATSTGGFATHSSSIAYYNSAAVEAICVVLMLLGATNFLLIFMLMRGRLRAFLGHVETAVFAGIVAAAAVAIAALFVVDGVYPGWAEALRHSLFQVVAVISSAGLQTIPSYAGLAPSVLFIFVALMFVGGEAGSTSGGMKVYRVALAARGLYWDLRERYGGGRRVFSCKVNRFGKRAACTEDELRGVEAFVVVYVLIFVAGSFAFTLCGASVQDAVFDFASCLGNTGVGIGFVSASSSPAVLCVGIAGMVLGRLEIVTVAVGLWSLTLGLERGAEHER